jgi:transcriptional regulator with XRE-family HTH domain
MIFFSRNLRYLRELAGKKQLELSSFLGVKPNTISNYEKGISQPDFILLEKIVEYFKVSSDEILFSDMQNPKSSSLKSDCIDKGALEMIRDLAGENAVLRKENEQLKRGDYPAARDAGYAAAG